MDSGFGEGFREVDVGSGTVVSHTLRGLSYKCASLFKNSHTQRSIADRY